MIERQDIDALLISALYGELDAADEARLNAHLDSHPADKTALADLTFARAAVRESRFLTVQLEPPQAVSALLLQEASRRAKPVPMTTDKSEGWFSRFVSAFARHPAMAAAAMLVLVVGVAGVMYARGGAQSAERTTRTFAEGAPAMESRKSDEAEELQRNAGSGYVAQLAEADAGVVAAPGATGADQQGDLAKAERSKDALAGKKATRTYLQPESKPPAKPMDFEDRKQDPKGGFAKPDTSIANLDGADEDRATRKTGRTPPPVGVVPRNDPAITNAPATPQAPKTVGRSGAGDSVRDGKEKNEKSDEETTWAREQHGKVANAVRANNCKEATQLAMALFNRAPAYYNVNVESDRALKQCMTYITAEREREIERTQRARALQRRNADEVKRSPAKSPAPTTNDSK